jgi:glycerol-3-phosphate dehydrogenase subunit B
MDIDRREIFCDLAIIGGGLAGMAAALFAGGRGTDTVQVGMPSQLGFASGLLDLLGVHPVAEGRLLEDPWQGIAQLRRDEPGHPYCRMDDDGIRAALAIFLEFLDGGSLAYTAGSGRNLWMLTPAGTIKPTYAVPRTMAAGTLALAEQAPCLLVDFKGLRGFSARLIAMSLADRWPGLRPLSIEFPDAGQGERYPEHMARALDSAERRKALSDTIRPHLQDACCVGLPAVLGMYRSGQALAQMQAELGVPIFEIPTMPPAVPGLRLQEIFESRLPPLGVHLLRNHRVRHAARTDDGRWRLTLDNGLEERPQLTARAVLLCSGRFFGGGLQADRREGVCESLFNLPVAQPARRTDWHHHDLFHLPGHPIHRAGVVTDARLRPVDSAGRTIHPGLFAAGSILAHQDWVRQKCGSGLALATAYRAVQACAEYLKGC